MLTETLNEIQTDDDPRQHSGEVSFIEKDFGQKVNQDVEVATGLQHKLAGGNSWPKHGIGY